MMRGMQRIPVRKDFEPHPPRLFRGYKRVVENPEDYNDFEGLVKSTTTFSSFVKQARRSNQQEM